MAYRISKTFTKKSLSYWNNLKCGVYLYTINYTKFYNYNIWVSEGNVINDVYG